MTNVMKAKPLGAIHERAMTFVSRCAEAGKKSVDVYVCLLTISTSNKMLMFIVGTSPLLRSRLCHSLHVQSGRAQVPRHPERL